MHWLEVLAACSRSSNGTLRAFIYLKLLNSEMRITMICFLSWAIKKLVSEVPDHALAGGTGCLFSQL